MQCHRMLALAMTACGASSKATYSEDKKDDTAKSAADLGGMDKLIATAKKEGALNVITLPSNWANYGELMDGFSKKYGIKVTDGNPDGSSADESAAIKSLKGQNRAPDAVAVGQAFVVSGAKEKLFAPYKVATFDQIPSSLKDADGNWVNDYGGYVSIGCDAKKVSKFPKTLKDLEQPMRKGMMALNGDPLKANAAVNAVYATSLANGGSLDDIQPGIDFFGKLNKAGIYKPVQATAARIESGETPIVRADDEGKEHTDPDVGEHPRWLRPPLRGRARRRFAPGLSPLPTRGARMAALVLLWFLPYMVCFLVVPLGLIAGSAFRHDVDGYTAFFLQNTLDSLQGAYLTGLPKSIKLAVPVAVLASILGLVLTWAVISTGSSRLAKAVSTSSAVLANFANLPLAFLFTAVLGTTGGVLTKMLQDWFVLSLRDDLHFNLYSLTGVELVYLYFLVPRMVLVISPALEVIKLQWKEIAESLGASRGEYWHHVAMPMRLPQVLGAVMLLFCSAFSACATA